MIERKFCLSEPCMRYLQYRVDRRSGLRIPLKSDTDDIGEISVGINGPGCSSDQSCIPKVQALRYLLEQRCCIQQAGQYQIVQLPSFSSARNRSLAVPDVSQKLRGIVGPPGTQTVVAATPSNWCRRGLVVVYCSATLSPLIASAAPKAARVASWKPHRMSLRLPG